MHEPLSAVDAHHILDRANGRLRWFNETTDFAARKHFITQAHERLPLRMLGFVVMGLRRLAPTRSRRSKAGQAIDARASAVFPHLVEPISHWLSASG